MTRSNAWDIFECISSMRDDAIITYKDVTSVQPFMKAASLGKCII
jgi:hypothetical protein